MPDAADTAHVRTQYSDARRLDARIALHARFSVNPQGWQEWVLAQMELSQARRVLEVGAGPAPLWRARPLPLAPEAQVTLTDLFPGMARIAQAAVADDLRFAVAVADVQALPFPAATFDVAIANHMLYHVPDRPRALAELRRVLRPGGVLYATTVGREHMRELWQLLAAFDPAAADDPARRPKGFEMEDGAAQLAPWFAACERRDYPDHLWVTEAEPLVEYVLSTAAAGVIAPRLAAFREHVARALAPEGGIRINKSSGILIARR